MSSDQSPQPPVLPPRDLLEFLFGDLFRLLFGFQGRLNRAKYWAAMALAGVAELFLAGVVWANAQGVNPAFPIVEIVIVVLLPGLLSFVAISVRRLHDRNKSGWWLLLFYVLPAVISRFASAAGSALGYVLGLVILALSIWALLELGVLGGSAGPNDYGPDPLAR